MISYYSTEVKFSKNIQKWMLKRKDGSNYKLFQYKYPTCSKCNEASSYVLLKSYLLRLVYF